MAMKKSYGGRPSMFVPETRKAIKRSLLAGNSYESAAQTVGVRSTSLYRWFRLFPDFRKKCKRWRLTGRLRPVRAYATSEAGPSMASRDRLRAERERLIRLRERLMAEPDYAERTEVLRRVWIEEHCKKHAEEVRAATMRQAANSAVSGPPAVQKDAIDAVLEARILPIPAKPAFWARRSERDRFDETWA